jgi:hypothetical protein
LRSKALTAKGARKSAKSAKKKGSSTAALLLAGAWQIVFTLRTDLCASKRRIPGSERRLRRTLETFFGVSRLGYESGMQFHRYMAEYREGSRVPTGKNGIITFTNVFEESQQPSSFAIART